MYKLERIQCNNIDYKQKKSKKEKYRFQEEQPKSPSQCSHYGEVYRNIENWPQKKIFQAYNM